MAATLFAGCVVFVCAMLIWFRVVRPVLEDYGVIVNPSEDDAPAVMSRSALEGDRLGASALQTDGASDRQTAQPAPLAPEIMLDICRDLRAHGYSRDGARALLRKLGQPLDNNIWAKAQPAQPADDDTLITPYAGRRTRASYYPDEPDLEYQSPAT